MFTELKETMPKELRESMRMSHQQRTSVKRQYKREPNRNSAIGKYNN